MQYHGQYQEIIECAILLGVTGNIRRLLNVQYYLDSEVVENVQFKYELEVELGTDPRKALGRPSVIGQKKGQRQTSKVRQASLYLLDRLRLPPSNLPLSALRTAGGK